MMNRKFLGTRAQGWDTEATNKTFPFPFQPKHPQSLLKNPKPITHTIVVAPANANGAASSITSTGTTTTVVNPKLFSRLSPVLPAALPVNIKTESPSTTVRYSTTSLWPLSF